MKKLLCMLTAVLLVFGAIPAAAAETPGEEPGYILPEYSYEELVIGNTTPVEGRFFYRPVGKQFQRSGRPGAAAWL